MKYIMALIDFGNQIAFPPYPFVLPPYFSRVGLVLTPEEGQRRYFKIIIITFHLRIYNHFTF